MKGTADQVVAARSRTVASLTRPFTVSSSLTSVARADQSHMLASRLDTSSNRLANPEQCLRACLRACVCECVCARVCECVCVLMHGVLSGKRRCSSSLPHPETGGCTLRSSCVRFDIRFNLAPPSCCCPTAPLCRTTPRGILLQTLRSCERNSALTSGLSLAAAGVGSRPDEILAVPPPTSFFPSFVLSPPRVPKQTLEHVD